MPPEVCAEPVQSFQAFTADLERMAGWLKSNGIVTVAMESTGVYWVPSMKCWRATASRQCCAMREMPGWFQAERAMSMTRSGCKRLHACGLLRASFRPGREIAALREYLRLRERHVQDAAAHIQHMQKR